MKNLKVWGIMREWIEMTWDDPPKFIPAPTKQSRKVTPEALAKSGSEDGEQMALFAWAADNVTTYPQLAWLFAIPNGGSRHIAEATKMVATGLRRGVPDVFLPVHNTFTHYSGCFIEMKIKNNKTSRDQDKWIKYLTDAGYYCKVCYSWIEARDTLIAYLEGKI